MTPDTNTPILVVDDEEPVRRLLKRVLERGGYGQVGTASSARAARTLLEEGEYHLLMTDMQMPGESGMSLLELLREEQPDLATIIVTGVDDPALVNEALDRGAYGYVVKPFKPTEVLININNALRRRSLELENLHHRTNLEVKVKERTAELWQAIQRVEHSEKIVRASRSETIRRLATAAEYRDEETGHHVIRMSRYCHLLAKAIGLPDEHSAMILEASELHDIGKIGIPDRVLLKTKAFTPEDREIMEQHAELGYGILADSESEVLQLAATIARTHHERFDGTGYPRGLKGEEIPVEGRIAAIADVFDALTTHRVYRRAFPVGIAVEMMKKDSGTHFDPELLQVFWSVLPDVLAVKERYESQDVLAPAM
jgi:putative two-component system response regulator